MRKLESSKVSKNLAEQTRLNEEDILLAAEAELENMPIYNDGVRTVDFRAVAVGEGETTVDMPADFRFAGMSDKLAYFFRAGETTEEREQRAMQAAINTLMQAQFEAQTAAYGAGPQYDESGDAPVEEADGDDNIIRDLFNTAIEDDEDAE